MTRDEAFLAVAKAYRRAGRTPEQAESELLLVSGDSDPTDVQRAVVEAYDLLEPLVCECAASLMGNAWHTPGCPLH